MFKPNTLFVIGAGAGQEVGLPIGTELSNVIANKLYYSQDTIGVVSGGDADIGRLLLGQATKMGIGAGLLRRRPTNKTRHTFSRSIDEYITSIRMTKTSSSVQSSQLQSDNRGGNSKRCFCGRNGKRNGICQRGTSTK